MALKIPEFLQTQQYTAMRDRLVLAHGARIQPGVWNCTARNGGDFAVTQRSTTANMSVDVAAGYAIVAATDPGNRGYYHIENDAVVNKTVGASHGSFPRIDRVVAIVNDSQDGGDLSDTADIQVVQGTPTSGATLDNLNGQPTVPTSSLVLADVLVPAASSTVTTANIRDRRAWARGEQVFALNGAASIELPVDYLLDRFLVIEGEFQHSVASATTTIRPNNSAAGQRMFFNSTAGTNVPGTSSATGVMNDTGFVAARDTGGSSGVQYTQFCARLNMSRPPAATGLMSFRSDYIIHSTTLSGGLEASFGFLAGQRTDVPAVYSISVVPSAGTLTGTLKVQRTSLMPAT